MSTHVDHHTSTTTRSSSPSSKAFFRGFMELCCPVEAVLIAFTRVEFLREEHLTDVQRGLGRADAAAPVLDRIPHFG